MKNCCRFAFLLLLAALAGLAKTPVAPEPLDLQAIPAVPSPRPLIWLGHNQPDCDSLACAIAGAALWGGEARVFGEAGNEARFLLKAADVPMPSEYTPDPAAAIVLVDHSQLHQSPPGLAQEQVVAVLDHHPWDEDTVRPLHAISGDFRPWCAASAIVADDYLRSGRAMPRPIAILLLGGILSDTTALMAPLSPRETQILQELSRLAGIPDPKAFGLRMLQAKSDYSAQSARTVLLGDYKEYIDGKLHFGFGLAETLDPAPLLRRASELADALAAERQNRHLDYLFFAVKDLTAGRAYLLVRGASDDALRLIDAAYAAITTDGAPSPDWRCLRKTSRKNALIPCSPESP